MKSPAGWLRVKHSACALRYRYGPSTFPLPLSPAYCLCFRSSVLESRAQHPCACVHIKSCTAISCSAKSRQFIRHLHAVQKLLLISMWYFWLFLSFLYGSIIHSQDKMLAEYGIIISPFFCKIVHCLFLSAGYRSK